MATGADQHGEWHSAVAVPAGTSDQRDLPAADDLRTAPELAADAPADHPATADRDRLGADGGPDHHPARPDADHDAADHDAAEFDAVAQAERHPVHHVADTDGVTQADDRVTHAERDVRQPQ